MNYWNNKQIKSHAASSHRLKIESFMSWTDTCEKQLIEIQLEHKLKDQLGGVSESEIQIWQ